MIYSVFPGLGKSYTARVTMAGKAIDAESSKFMWITIVVALAAAIFIIAKPQITSLAKGLFEKVGQVVSGTNVTTSARFITELFD